MRQSGHTNAQKQFLGPKERLVNIFGDSQTVKWSSRASPRLGGQPNVHFRDGKVLEHRNFELSNINASQ